MTHLEEYKRWQESPYITDDEQSGLMAMSPDDIAMFFGRGLAFGTSGVRGIMTMGEGGINRFTIYRYAHAYAEQLAENGACRVLVCRDCRENGDVYMQAVIGALHDVGISPYIFKGEYAPTPLLSFAIAYGEFDGGINITSSHNTKEYNGLKLYDSTGALISDDTAELIEQRAGLISLPCKINMDIRPKEIGGEAAIAYSAAICEGIKSKGELPVLFTPLYGVSGEIFKKNAQRCGFDVSYLWGQMAPDGAFPGLKSPNPEDEETMTEACDFAAEHGSELIIALDPDGDRMGVMVKHESGFIRLNPNQTALILLEHLIDMEDGLEGNYALVTTRVSGEAPRMLAKKNGMRVIITPTGFKNMSAERINQQGLGVKTILAFEEALGYMSHRSPNDKDGIGSAILLIAAAEKWQKRGKTLYEAAIDIMAEIGYYDERWFNYPLNDIGGVEAFAQLASKIAEKKQEYPIKEFTHIGAENTIRIDFENGRLWVRPSGTEPKLKLYGHGRGESLDEAAANAESAIAFGVEIVTSVLGE